MGRKIVINVPPASAEEMHTRQRANRIRIEDDLLSAKETDIIDINNSMLPPHFLDRHVPAELLIYDPKRPSQDEEPQSDAAESGESAQSKPDKQESQTETETDTKPLGTPMCTHVIDLKTSPEVDEPHMHVISDRDEKDAFELIESTSGEDYRHSRKGWHPKAKKREMRELYMHYLFVRNGAAVRKKQIPELVRIDGFLSFMLTYEDGLPVIYIYEIHLKSEARGCGLGAHLLKIVETIGASVGVEKSMLTVFRSNEHARNWYETRGYEIDPYSPADKRFRNGKVKQADYLILSKKLPKKNAGPKKVPIEGVLNERDEAVHV